MPQHAGIIQNLLSASCIENKPVGLQVTQQERNIAAIECCAGRARLSLALQRHCYGTNPTGTNLRTNFILVDRATRRRRADKSLDAHPSCTTNRLTMDMADIALAGLPAVQRADNVLVFGKHLSAQQQIFFYGMPILGAGATTKFSVEAVYPDNGDLCSLLPSFMQWDSLVGRDVLTGVGISAEDFSVLRRLCTYYRKKTRIYTIIFQRQPY